jgi:type IX secretion system substrate protein
MRQIHFHYTRVILRFLTLITVLSIVLFSMQLKSQDISTIREIYDYNISDVFHYDYEGGDGTNAEFRITNIEILDKYYSPDNSILYYVRDIAKKTRSSWEPEWEYSYYIDTFSYANLDSLINEGDIDTVFTRSNLYNGRLINQYLEGNGNYNSSSDYVVGCGLASWYYSSVGGGISESHLVYYQKGSEVWGQKLQVGIIDNDFQDKQILIYPNPASTVINVEFNEPVAGYVLVYSISGKFIKKIELRPELRTIDISNFKPDSYLFKFYLPDNIIFKKIIKK